MLNYMLIKHKNIFECFNCFLKVFCFCKNFKNCVALFWQLGCRSIKLHAPGRKFTQKVFTIHWQVNVSVKKKTQKIFRNSGFLQFSQLGLVTCSRVEASVVRLYRNFHGSLCDLLASGPSSCEKYLDKYFKICHTDFWRLELATSSRLNPVAKNVCFAL